MEDTRHRKTKSCVKERMLEYVSSLKEIRERTRKLFRNNKLVEMMYVLRDTGLTYLVKRRADGQVVMTPRRRKRRSKRNTGAAKEKSSRHNNSSASTSSGRRRRRKHRHDHQEPYCQHCEDRRERREQRHAEGNEHREYRDSLVHHRKHYKHRGGNDHEHGAHQPPVESIQSPTDNSPIMGTERPEPLSDRMTRMSDFMAPRSDAAPAKPASYSDKPLPRLPRPERESTRMTRMSDFMAPVSEAAQSRPVSYSDYELPEERLSIFSELHLDDGKREHKPHVRSTGEMGKSVRLSSMASVATFKTEGTGTTSPVDKPSGGQGLNSLIHQELRNGWSSDEDDSSSSDYSDDEGDEYEEGEEEIIDLNGDD
ncbi:hypothetical protein DIS24_g12069 [Lasiodiplodia hormozganensis]|uniref:Uncharacterized protein n=1 Tax=Lasiodiplodia hormozganensis TaxID=869390 RepID=A0AA39WAI4_9PEZI|nr:hypothetical protein DIS24_g12069 [Lasiodiplodia hormozganensis]